MTDLSLDLRFMKYAILAAEYGSFRRVAKTLEVSQSTVSRRVLLLERRLGVQLFERRRTGVVLTPAGRRFIEQASDGVERLQKAIEGLKRDRQGASGELRVGIMASLAFGFLGDLLAEFHRRYPLIDLKLEECSSQGIGAAVARGRLDVGFILGEPSMPDCETMPLWDETLYVAMPEHHPLSTRAAFDLWALREEAFLVAAGVAGPDLQNYLVRHLSSPGFFPTVSVQGVGRENLLNMVAKGFGITLTTVSTLGTTYPGVQFRPLIGPDTVATWSVVKRKKDTNPALSTLLRLAREMRSRDPKAGRCSVPHQPTT